MGRINRMDGTVLIQKKIDRINRIAQDEQDFFEGVASLGGQHQLPCIPLLFKSCQS